MSALREYVKLKYAGDCKCGDCQLVPTRVLYEEIVRAEAVQLALDGILKSLKSHVDGRDLLDELHPRHEIDIRVRRDGVERWHEGDWLSNLRDTVRAARNVLTAISPAKIADQSDDAMRGAET